MPVDGFTQIPAPERGFVSSVPATTWEEGLITGNGTIGANVFGRPLDETVIFTHERMFLPQGPPTVPPDNGARIGEIRSLIAEGKYKEATGLAFEFSGQRSFMYPDPFVPVFDMNIKMDGKIAFNFMRSVDFQTGETIVRWSDERGAFDRRLFVSRADGIAVMKISGPSGQVSFRVSLQPRNPSEKLGEDTLNNSNNRFRNNITDVVKSADGATLTWRNGFARAYPGSIQAIEGAVYVATFGGKTVAQGDELVVSGADEVVLLVAIEPIYDAGGSKLAKMRGDLDTLPMDYDALLAEHVRIHGELFNRMRLDLGGRDHGLTTEELLAKTSNEELSRTLIEKEFDAGRYNIICSTGELPPVLQGVWGGTYVPGWASDFTHNGNVPSAIASMLMGNTPELMLAYTSYIESIVPGMEISAKNIFGARGIVLPSRSTTHGYNNALAPNFAGGFWVGGASWAAHFFYDYYLYTGDEEFLKEHALPFMEKAALFFEDYLYEGADGKLVFSPTQSPENTPGNTDSQGSFNATSEVAMAKELLRNTIAASRELSVNADKIPVWEAMLMKMPSYMVGPDGALKEWSTPLLDDQHGHRHSSHLYALFDGMPEEIADDPALQAAFRKVIEIKLDRHWKEGSGFMSFGVVQLGLTAASLGESKLAYRCLVHLVNRYWLNNLASMHNHKSLFNMDISGGMPAVIIKMLVASSPGRIQLLPALPEEWKDGTIEGVLCRGQIEINRLNWNSDRIELTLTSQIDQVIDIEFGQAKSYVATLRAGQETKLVLERDSQG
ncbi:MAG: glycoside hydrolase N-terminal domain-containing protein [Armatimonadetes bacterium]|nr:glycoside hydrolase N-terminal domain-containing protein [Armatimonadota bacterium]